MNALHLPPLCKRLFNHNFGAKALRMRISVSRTTFLRSRNPMVPIILPVTLTFVESHFGPYLSY